MLDSIYHMTLRLILNLISGLKTLFILPLCTQRCYGRHIVSRKSVIMAFLIQTCNIMG